MRFKIICPKCRAQKSGDTRHGFKLFALMHGIKCDAKSFNQTEQFTISDFLGEKDDSEE